MTTPPLVFLDTETTGTPKGRVHWRTGVHPGRKVWEIAMIRRDEEGQREMQTFVDDHLDLSAADPFGLAVGRFYERHPFGRYLAGGPYPAEGELPPLEETATAVARWTHGAHIVGAVPHFDTETLAPLLRACGLIPSWHYHLIDVGNLAVGYITGRYPDEAEARAVSLPWDSDELTAALGLDPVADEERHTALGDARWAMRIYDTVMGRIPQ